MKGGRTLSRARDRGRSFPKVRSRGAFHGHPRFSAPLHPLLQLQQTIGNQAVSRLLQGKFKLSQPGDKSEEEADRMAATVMRMAELAPAQVQEENNHEKTYQMLQMAPLTTSSEGKREEEIGEDAVQAKPLLRRNSPLVQRQDLQNDTEVVEDILQPKTSTNGSARGSSNMNTYITALKDRGQPLSPKARAFFEPHFGQNFSRVRVHADSQGAEAAKAIKARAFTIGHNIVFGKGQYAPHSSEGQKLLAHELTHVVQQQSPSMRMVQRDLKAYNTSKSEVLSGYTPESMMTHMIKMSAEGPGIRRALSGLIALGKIKEVKSSNGHTSWFAAQHHKNVQLDEIRQALKFAGYSNPDRVARAIYDTHGEFLYANEELTTIAPFYNRTTSLGEKIETQSHRSMTEWEIREAQRVFGNSINYAKVTIAEGSISAKIGSAGGYARTVGNTIYFPPGGSRNMAFIIHELTHVWQYQTTGWTYAPKAIWAQMTEGYNYVEKGKTPEQSLMDASVAGKTLYDYNKEQQGDILRDYYRRLQQGKNTSAWQPFVNDI